MGNYLIDGHKLLWHLDRVTQWQTNRLIAPIYTEISPISMCNHRCIFCGIDFARDKVQKLDRDILCKRLEEMGQAGVRSIMFAGEGEPLMHKDLPEFVRVSKKSGIDVSITTNGTLGHYDLWNDMLQHLTWIRFSVDAGTSSVHSKVHGISETLFNKTVNSIEDAVKVKKDNGLDITIGVQFLIIEENINDIENALRLFSEIGVDYLSLKPYSLHPQMINKRDTVYSDAVIVDIENIIRSHSKDSGMNIIFRKEALMKYMHKENNFKHCCALPFWGYISTKGDFYTCSVFIDDNRFNVGNIYADNMSQILLGDKRKESIKYGEEGLVINKECRLNCRMARINEFLEVVETKPEHVNFI